MEELNDGALLSRNAPENCFPSCNSLSPELSRAISHESSQTLPRMPGCFSRLCDPFSKTNGQDAPAPNGESNRPSPAKEPVSSSGAKPAVNDAPNDPSADKKPSPSAEVAKEESPEKKEVPVPKDRWREAFKGLSEKDQKALEKLGFSDREPGPMGSNIQELVGTVREKQQACEDKFLKTTIAGKEIVFREYTTEIVGWLEKAGNIAIQFAPPQASLPWDLVKNLMKVSVNSCIISSCPPNSKLTRCFIDPRERK